MALSPQFVLHVAAGLFGTCAERDTRTLASEEAHDGSSYTSRATRDDNDLSLKTHFCPLIRGAGVGQSGLRLGKLRQPRAGQVKNSKSQFQCQTIFRIVEAKTRQLFDFGQPVLD